MLSGYRMRDKPSLMEISSQMLSDDLSPQVCDEDRARKVEELSKETTY